MQINDELNLVLDVGNGFKLYHSPISKAVFEANFKIIAAVKAELASKGIHYQMESGPRIASLTLKDEAAKLGLDDNCRALLVEIKRLSMVLIPTDLGWSMLPVDSAIKSGKIDDEDWQEVESALVFFTAHLSMANRKEKAKVAKAASSLLMGYVTSLDCSGLADSLLKSTQEDATVAQVASSVPV